MLETEQAAVAGADAGGQRAAAQQVAAEEHRGAAQGTGADETATAEADHFFQVGGLVSSNRLTSGSLLGFADTLMSVDYAFVAAFDYSGVPIRTLDGENCTCRLPDTRPAGAQLQRLSQGAERLAVGQSDAHFAGAVLGIENGFECRSVDCVQMLQLGPPPAVQASRP
jgi:hypothetical protein